MKTVELIPLILLELASGEKYGIELTKSIETKSNGKVVIKQPTLYTILKKLEKSKFISSFWQDSEIGGKRHYYKLTENGRQQVSTLPSFSSLIDSLSNDEDESQTEPQTPAATNDSSLNSSHSDFSQIDEAVSQFESNNSLQSPKSNLNDDGNYEQQTFGALLDSDKSNKIIEDDKPQKQEYLSIMDLLGADDEKSDDLDSVNNSVNSIDSNGNSKESLALSTPQPTDIQMVETKIEPIESVLPSEEVFSLSELDAATTQEINQQNTQMLKSSAAVKDEKFATSSNVYKFTEKNTPLSEEYKSKLEKSMSGNSVKSFLTASKVAMPNLDVDIPYVDYINFKTEKNYIYSKKLAKNMMYRILSSCAYLMLMLIITSIVVNHTKTSPLYNIFLIVSILCILFSIAIYLLNYEKFRLKHKAQTLKLDFKKQTLIVTGIFVAIFILTVIVSLASGHVNVFNISNFANFYAPLLISTVWYMDILFTYLFLRKYI